MVVKINPKLQDALDRVAVRSSVTTDMVDGIVEFERYLIPTPMTHSDNWDSFMKVFFAKDLVDNGEITFKVDKYTPYHSFMNSRKLRHFLGLMLPLTREQSTIHKFYTEKDGNSTVVKQA